MCGDAQPDWGDECSSARRGAQEKQSVPTELLNTPLFSGLFAEINNLDNFVTCAELCGIDMF